MGTAARTTILPLLMVLSSCGPSHEEIEQKKRLVEMHRIAVQTFGSAIDADLWGRWPVSSVEMTSDGKVNVIRVVIDVPPAQGQEIMARPPEAQFRAVGWGACPRSTQHLWSKFDQRDRLELQARVNGHVFIDVDCKRWRIN